MTRISKITLNANRKEKQDARELVGLHYSATERLSRFPGALELLSHTALAAIDRKVKHGKDLTFEEAFCGMCYVLAATNARFYDAVHGAFAQAYKSSFSHEKAIAYGTAFVQLMAAKESMRHLTPDEVAGIAAASMMDTVIQLKREHVIETCGMGGDLGFAHNGVVKKTINVSTLSALVLAALGYPVAKHGSYGNTSAVGSTEAIELLGANTSLTSVDQVEALWKTSGFIFLDAHWCKTIHDLSHLLMMETINHVAGPMSPPFTPETLLTKLMGVNEKVHPSVIARAYGLLHERGLQLNSGIAIVCGLDAGGMGIDPYDEQAVRAHTIVDELSPFASVVSIAHGDLYKGSFIVRPEDFGVSIDPLRVQVTNTQEDILRANMQALQNEDKELARYLAMNSAVAMLVENYQGRDDLIVHNRLNAKYLRECYNACLQAIQSGKAWAVLQEHVRCSFLSVC